MIILKKVLKIVPVGLLVFFLLSLAGGVLLKISPMPESWGYGYIVAVFSLTCFITSFYMGLGMEKAGLLTGIVTSAFMIIIIFLLISVCFNTGKEISSLFRIAYLIPLFIGTLGGIIGVNVNK